jgi:cytochrome c oxidase subunit III
MTTEVLEFEKKTAVMGMWVFIGSEVLFFGGLFLSLTIYRGIYQNLFDLGTHHMNLWVGTLNTAILLTSSWTLAMAIEKIKQQIRPFFLLIITVLLGILFLVLKAYEYHQHYDEGVFPGVRWIGSQFPSQQMILFFFLYFFMTALHALHVLIGLGLIGWLAFHLRNLKWSAHHEGFVENVGLYWHFVDIVWVFLFPMLYLVGRS